MIIIFCDFRPSSAKNWRFSSKNNVIIRSLQKTDIISNQKTPKFSSKTILKIITSVHEARSSKFCESEENLPRPFIPTYPGNEKKLKNKKLNSLFDEKIT
jgi:hypothetical protein